MSNQITEQVEIVQDHFNAEMDEIKKRFEAMERNYLHEITALRQMIVPSAVKSKSVVNLNSVDVSMSLPDTEDLTATKQETAKVEEQYHALHIQYELLEEEWEQLRDIKHATGFEADGETQQRLEYLRGNIEKLREENGTLTSELERLTDSKACQFSEVDLNLLHAKQGELESTINSISSDKRALIDEANLLKAVMKQREDELNQLEVLLGEAILQQKSISSDLTAEKSMQDFTEENSVLTTQIAEVKKQVQAYSIYQRLVAKELSEQDYLMNAIVDQEKRLSALLLVNAELNTKLCTC
jgi:hypothetical protein